MSEQEKRPESSEEDTITLTLYVDGHDDIDDNILRQLTGHLRSELEDLNVESVIDVRDQELPPGAKGIDPFTVGALIVAVLPSFLPKVLEFVQAWTLRGEGQSVKIKAQSGDRSVEVEYPMRMAPDEAKKHIEMVVDELIEKKF